MHAPIKPLDAPKTHKSLNILRHSRFEVIWEAKHAHDTHLGMRWDDMPGDTPDMQKMNYYLFKKGRLYDPELFPRMSPLNRQRYSQFIQRASSLRNRLPKTELSF